MKKTRKILSLTALLLAAVTLLTSCGINYRTANAADYVSVGEAGYKNLAVSANKTVISDEDINKMMFQLQYDNKTAVTETNDDGIIKAFDVVSLRLGVYDSTGKAVFSQFGLDSSKYNGTDSSGNKTYTLAAVSGLSLPVGYGEYAISDVKLSDSITLSAEFLRTVEDALLGAQVNDHKLEDRWDTTSTTEGAVNSKMAVPFKGFFSVSYTASYFKNTTDTTATPGGSAAPVTIDTYVYEGKEKGTNSYEEAIYLGLQKYAETYDIYCRGSQSSALPITVNVVPTANEGTEALPTGDANAVYIYYDLDFEDTSKGTTYRKGGIATTVLFAYSPYDQDLSEDGERFAQPLTDDEGKLLTWTDDKEKEYTVRIFVEKRTPYKLAELTADLIKKAEHADHMDDLTGSVEELLAKYKAHLQAEADREAELAAMDALWKKAMAAASTDGKKSSASFAKDYRNEMINSLKVYYYDYGWSYVYDSFEEYVVRTVDTSDSYKDLREAYLDTVNSNGEKKLPLEYKEGSTTEYTKASIKASYRLVKDMFYQDGLVVAKERALTYVLADQLGVRLTDSELKAKLADIVKEANDEAYETIRDMCTVDAGEEETDVKTELKNALVNYGADSTKVGKLSVKELAAAYLDSIYGVDTLEELKEKELVTEESYLNVNDKETLFGAWQLNAVKEKLLESNKDGVTYVEIDTDGNKLDKDTADGE